MVYQLARAEVIFDSGKIKLVVHDELKQIFYIRINSALRHAPKKTFILIPWIQSTLHKPQRVYLKCKYIESLD